MLFTYAYFSYSINIIAIFSYYFYKITHALNKQKKSILLSNLLWNLIRPHQFNDCFFKIIWRTKKKRRWLSNEVFSTSMSKIFNWRWVVNENSYNRTILLKKNIEMSIIYCHRAPLFIYSLRKRMNAFYAVVILCAHVAELPDLPEKFRILEVFLGCFRFPDFFRILVFFRTFLNFLGFRIFSGFQCQK
jgi:hypothetical protein